MINNFSYNRTYFDGCNLYDTKNRVFSLKVYPMANGILLGMFQGSRGDRPDLDFILKFLPPGEKRRLRTPSHTHWIVDLLLKYENSPEEVYSFSFFYRKLYDDLQPFETIEERNNYRPFTPAIIQQRFPHLHNKGQYSLEYLAHLIELFIICEKRTEGSFMFRNLLQLMIDYCEGAKDYFQVISNSKRV